MLLTRSSRFVLAFAAAALMLTLTSGCRNATNAPISPLGQASPLTPVSPLQPQLSPIQQTSGISPFGASTRVPPPPTTPDASFNASAPFNSSYAPTTGYAPSTFAPTGSSGTAGIGPSAVNSLGATTPASKIRQTGWVGQSKQGAGFGSNFGNAPSFGNNQPNFGPAPSSARSGGLPVIDLTRAPNPPGYAPPANFAPNVGYPAGYIPPENRGNFSGVPANQNPNGAPLGQPVNSSFSRDSVNGFDSNTLPSTEPLPGGRTASGDQLNWQRPSPRF